MYSRTVKEGGNVDYLLTAIGLALVGLSIAVLRVMRIQGRQLATQASVDERVNRLENSMSSFRLDHKMIDARVTEQIRKAMLPVHARITQLDRTSNEILSIVGDMAAVMNVKREDNDGPTA